MFFIVMILDHFIHRAGSSITASIDDRDCKKRWKKHIADGEWKSDTWVDRRGVERDIYSNEIRKTTRINGDRVLIDEHCHVVRNYTQEARAEEFIKLCNNPEPYKTVIQWEGNNPDPGAKRKIQGIRYKDVETGRFFVKRKVGTNRNHMAFYMDAETGEYIRPTDEELASWDRCGVTEEYAKKAEGILKAHLEFKKRHPNLDPYDNFSEC